LKKVSWNFKNFTKRVGVTTASATSCLPNKNTAEPIDASIIGSAAFFFARHGRVAAGWSF